MSCAGPNIPTSKDVRQSAWTNFVGADVTNPAQYYPIAVTPITLSGMVESPTQAFELVQFEMRETISAGAMSANAIRVFFYTDAAPAGITPAAVYNPSVTNLLGHIDIAEADWGRVSATVNECKINPTLHLKAGILETAHNLYITAYYTDATPNDPDATMVLAVRATTRLNLTTT